MAIIKYFEQITPSAVGHWRHREVIHQQYVRLGPLRERSRISTAAVRDSELLGESGHLEIGHRVA